MRVAVSATAMTNSWWGRRCAGPSPPRRSQRRGRAVPVGLVEARDAGKSRWSRTRPRRRGVDVERSAPVKREREGAVGGGRRRLEDAAVSNARTSSVLRPIRVRAPNSRRLRERSGSGAVDSHGIAWHEKSPASTTRPSVGVRARRVGAPCRRPRCRRLRCQRLRCQDPAAVVVAAGGQVTLTGEAQEQIRNGRPRAVGGR
jgi:hypothetical protein